MSRLGVVNRSVRSRLPALSTSQAVSTGFPQLGAGSRALLFLHKFCLVVFGRRHGMAEPGQASDIALEL